jgi:hypothetical protein
MIYLKLSVCRLLAAFGGGAFLSVQLAAADEASHQAPPFAAEQKGNADDGAGAEAGWRLIHGTSRDGKSGAAILRTADFERSDSRLAGLMERCGGAQGIETVIVVVEPFPPHAKPQVSLRTPERSLEFAGSIIPTGAGIRLPLDAAKLEALEFGKADEIEVKVTSDGAAIKGVVALTGLPKALARLNAECSQR